MTENIRSGPLIVSQLANRTKRRNGPFFLKTPFAICQQNCKRNTGCLARDAACRSCQLTHAAAQMPLSFHRLPPSLVPFSPFFSFIVITAPRLVFCPRRAHCPKRAPLILVVRVFLNSFTEAEALLSQFILVAKREENIDPNSSCKSSVKHTLLYWFQSS